MGHASTHPDTQAKRVRETKNAYKYIDSDIQTEKDKHGGKQTPTQIHRQRE
jgi:hypothetical protein